MIIVSGEQPLPAAPETHDPDFVHLPDYAEPQAVAIEVEAMIDRLKKIGSLVMRGMLALTDDVIELRDKMEEEHRQEAKTK
jgi:hypothetical protein